MNMPETRATKVQLLRSSMRLSSAAKRSRKAYLNSQSFGGFAASKTGIKEGHGMDYVLRGLWQNVLFVAKVWYYTEVKPERFQSEGCG